MEELATCFQVYPFSKEVSYMDLLTDRASASVMVYGRYEKRGDDVFFQWSFDGKRWNERLTPYRNPPYVIVCLSDFPFVGREVPFVGREVK